MHEIEVSRCFQQRALKDSRILSFVGAGAYHHHIPIPVGLASNPSTVTTPTRNLTGSWQPGGLAERLSELSAMDATHYAGSDLIASIVQGIKVVRSTLKKTRLAD